MKLYQCLLVNNPCYKKGGKMEPRRIVLHSTGANNPGLKRYVQPATDQQSGMGQVLPAAGKFTRYKLLQLLGTNNYANDYNRVVTPAKCVHGFIGRLFDRTVAAVQTLPWEMPCWGCASGPKGSYNADGIQIELCEDGLGDGVYLEQCWRAAVELCAHLCRHYKISPYAIVSHAEAHEEGYASNHGDPEHWFKLHGRTMDQFREAVDLELSLGAYAKAVQQLFGFDDNTMAFLRNHPYPAELLKKLATKG